MLPAIQDPGADEPTVRLLRGKWTVLGAAFGLAAVGLLYTLLTPARYEARSSVLLPSSKPQTAAGLAMSLGLNIGSGGDTSLPMFKRVLESERVLGIVSSKTGVPREDLRKMRSFDEDPKANLLTLSVTDTAPRRALAVNSAYLGALASTNAKLMLPSKSQRARLLLESLAAKEAELARAEQALERFNRTAITAPGTPTNAPGPGDASVPAVVPSGRYRDQLNTLLIELRRLNTLEEASRLRSEQAGRLRALDFPPVQAWKERLTQQEAELARLRATYRETSPEVQIAQKRRDDTAALMQREIDAYLRAVERRVSGPGAQVDQERKAILSQIASVRRLAAAAPREATEFGRLSRNVAMLTALVGQLRIQYEQARLDQADDPNRWEILDPPRLADEPVNKKYVRNGAIGFVAGLLLAIPLVLGRRRSRRGVDYGVPPELGAPPDARALGDEGSRTRLGS